MPIKHTIHNLQISNEAYHSLDYEIMRLVFFIHRDLGRFLNEKIYQNELAYRCEKAGIKPVAVEVPVEISFENFKKWYYLDLLINNVIYELKTVQNLSGEHQKQTINYLLLTGLQHAKLINFRPQSVEYRFVTTQLTPEKRYNFKIIDERWQDLDQDSVWLRHKFSHLLIEWGVFLDVKLFYEAIVYFLGGVEKVVQTVDVINQGRLLGKQKIHLLNPNIAFKFSAVTKNENYFEQHLQRLIQLLPLQAIHWINFSYNNVVFKTIVK